MTANDNTPGATLEIAKLVEPGVGKVYEWRLYRDGSLVKEGLVPWQGKPQKVRALIMRACRTNVPRGTPIEVVAVD